MIYKVTRILEDEVVADSEQEALRIAKAMKEHQFLFSTTEVEEGD